MPSFFRPTGTTVLEEVLSHLPLEMMQWEVKFIDTKVYHSRAYTYHFLYWIFALNNLNKDCIQAIIGDGLQPGSFTGCLVKERRDGIIKETRKIASRDLERQNASLHFSYRQEGLLASKVVGELYHAPGQSGFVAIDNDVELGENRRIVRNRR